MVSTLLRCSLSPFFDKGDATFICFAVDRDREGKIGDGGSASVSSEVVLLSGPNPSTVGTMDLGPLCHADFKVSEGAAMVCGGGC